MATHLLPAPPLTLKTNSPSSSPRATLSTSLLSPPVFGRDFSGHRIHNPSIAKRGGGVVRAVPSYMERSRRPPPDLATHLLSERIVYLGLGLAPQITGLIMEELLYLNHKDGQQPIKLYINSTGTEKNGRKIGYDSASFAVYDVMQMMEAPIYTLCVGHAWGESALLLAAGAKGHRHALPSATIVLKQPWDQFQGQASDVFLKGDFIKGVKTTLINLLAEHTGRPAEEIDADTRHPKYFSASEAVEYGLIDKVLYNERAPQDVGIVADLQRAKIV